MHEFYQTITISAIGTSVTYVFCVDLRTLLGVSLSVEAVMTATEFRKRLYAVLNEVAETGNEVTITHKGRSFRIVAREKAPFVDRLVVHDTLKVPADELVVAGASGWNWDEETNLDRIP